MRRVATLMPEGEDIRSHGALPKDAEPPLALLRFGPLEGRILNTLWSFNEITLADLHHLLGDAAISQSVLRSTLEKLHLKRLIRSRKVHRTCFYRAAFDRPTFIRLLRSQLVGFLGGDGVSTLLKGDDS